MRYKFSILKRFHHQSLRDIQYAVQMTTAFVMVSILVYKTSLLTIFPVGWVMPVIASVLMFDTVGQSILITFICIKNFVPLSVFIFILQKLGVGYQDYTSITILFFLTSFWMGYVNPSMATLKLALLLPVLLFTTLVTTPNNLVADNFIWTLLGELLLACCVSIATSVCVVPRFASIEIQDRLNYTFQRSAYVFELCMKGMLASHRAHADVYISEAEAIIRSLNDNQEVMNSRLPGAQMEPIFLIRFFLRRGQHLFSKHSPVEHIAIASNMLWHLTAMLNGVKHLKFNEYHADAMEYCSDAYEDMIRQYNLLMGCITGDESLHSDSIGRSGSDPHPHDFTSRANFFVIQHDTKLINQHISSLQKSSDHAFRVLSQTIHILELHRRHVNSDSNDQLATIGQSNPPNNLELPSLPLRNLSHNSLSQSHSQSRLGPTKAHSIRMPSKRVSFELSESFQRLDTMKTNYFQAMFQRNSFKESTTSSQHFSSLNQHEVNKPPDSPDGSMLRYDADAPHNRNYNRLATSFFYFHLSELVHHLQDMLTTTSPPLGTKDPVIIQTFSTSKTSKPIDPIGLGDGDVEMGDVESVTIKMDRSPSTPTKTDSTHPDAAPQASSAASHIPPSIGTRIYSFLNGIGLYFYNLVFTNSTSKMKTGIRTAIILTIGLIMVEVPQIAARFENGQWILFAMVFSQGDNVGGTLYQIRLRLLGTLFGCIFGYFVYIAVGDIETNFYGVIGIFVPFILFCGVFKQNKTWGYFGSISATSAMIVTMGRLTYATALPAGDFVLLRIQQNTIGVLLTLAVSAVVIPVLALDVLKFNMTDVLLKMTSSISKIWDVYEMTTARAEASEEPRSLHLASANDCAHLTTIIGSECTGVRTKLSQQPALIEQVNIELLVVGRPFPQHTYLQYIQSEQKIVQMMFSMDRALARVSRLLRDNDVTKISPRFLKANQSVVSYAKTVRSDVGDVLLEVIRNLAKWCHILFGSAAMPSTYNDVHESEESFHEEYGSRKRCPTIQDIDEMVDKLGRLEEESKESAMKTTHHLLDLEAERHTKAMKPFQHYKESQLEHVIYMEALHQAIIRLNINIVHFNNEMFPKWIDEIVFVIKEETINASHKEKNRTYRDDDECEAMIHQVFDVMTSFNALFFATSSLGIYAMELGNVLYTIVELERSGHHKSF